MIKPKVFELRIEDEDELSGIDSISLVDEPAIEVNWIAFKKDKDHDFHIPDGEDETYLDRLMAYAEDEQELLDDGYVFDRIVEEDEKLDFATEPNATSKEDGPFYRVRYKYALSPNISQSSIISTTRRFCRDLVNKNYVWREEDIESITNDFGDSARKWRGGYNCRHKWFKMLYKKDVTIINKASINKGKVEGPLGIAIDTLPDFNQPSTVTGPTQNNPSPSTIRNLGLSKDNFKECPEATQDVEVNLENRQRAIDEANYGPLNPNEPNEEYWNAKAKMFNGDVESAKKARCGNCAFFVKTPSMLECIAGGINDINQLDTIQAADLGYCEAFDFKCAAARTCDAWVGGGPITEENFAGMKVSLDYDGTLSTLEGKLLAQRLISQGYTVYVVTSRQDTSNAAAIYRRAEEVGIPRSRVYFTNGRPKLPTLRQLGIRRHYDNNPDVVKEINNTPVGIQAIKFDYQNGLPSYVDQIPKKKKGIIEKSLAPPTMFESHSDEKEKMLKQRFQTDDEKRIVLGPAMIPDMRIFRKDKSGNPYYVYFSAETIKMIAEKYMRNKYIDNNDTEHNGKAVKDVYVMESWIKEDSEDKSNKYGYNDLPIGTWFVSMKIKNDEVWKQVKNGILNGFSVSGYFEEVAEFRREEMFLRQVAEILKNVKE